MSAAPPLRVAAYGYFGMGNVGNEGSLAAFLAFLHDRVPDAQVHCFAAGPDAVTRDHGIPATRLMAHRALPGERGALAQARKAVGRLWDVPRTFRLMGDVDVLVVPGTGVLESQLVATPWGLPYWLFLAALSCRLRGRRVALVSVGAEPAPHPLTRRLFRATVRLAHHRSYRDEGSREAVRGLGIARPGEVFPDLAFSLDAPAVDPRPGHVVIGVMAYQGPPGDPQRGPAVVGRYVERLAEVVARLLDRGRSVTLVVGDVADLALAGEVAGRARELRPERDSGRVVVSGATTMSQLMGVMSTAEVVVGSRFHNVVAALRCCRPTVSLGYAGKNARLLERFGLVGLDQPMDDLDVDRLVQQVEEASSVASPARMREALAELQGALDDQFLQLSTRFLGRAVEQAEPVP